MREAWGNASATATKVIHRPAQVQARRVAPLEESVHGSRIGGQNEARWARFGEHLGHGGRRLRTGGNGFDPWPGYFIPAVGTDVRRISGATSTPVRLLTSAPTTCRGFNRGMEYPDWRIGFRHVQIDPRQARIECRHGASTSRRVGLCSRGSGMDFRTAETACRHVRAGFRHGGNDSRHVGIEFRRVGTFSRRMVNRCRIRVRG